MRIVNNSRINFKLFKIKEEFFEITNWQPYNIITDAERPTIMLAIEIATYPNTYCCIPLSKDNDKDNKYAKLSVDKPDLVHHVETLPEYDSYLLIQNMFFLRKEFFGGPYVGEGGVQLVIEDEQDVILKKIRKVDALMNRGKLLYVPRETVFEIQSTYINDKK